VTTPVFLRRVTQDIPPLPSAPLAFLVHNRGNAARESARRVGREPLRNRFAPLLLLRASQGRALDRSSSPGRLKSHPHYKEEIRAERSEGSFRHQDENVPGRPLSLTPARCCLCRCHFAGF
jgi:hypothetical protein